MTVLGLEDVYKIHGLGDQSLRYINYFQYVCSTSIPLNRFHKSNLLYKVIKCMNRILLVTTALLLGAFELTAQGQESTIDYFTTYFGRELQVGDTLWMGKPDYDQTRSILHEKKDDSEIFQRADLKDLHYKPLVITEFIPPKEVKTGVFLTDVITINAKCKAPDNTTLIVGIDQGIYDNVLQMYGPYNHRFRDSCVELTPLVRLVYYIQTEQKKVDDETLLEYILLKDPEKGEVCRYDKFEFRRVKDQFTRLLQEDLATLKKQMENGTTFYEKRRASTTSQTYDPEIGGYQITKVNNCENSYFEGYNNAETYFIYQPCETILKMSESDAEHYERKLRGDNPHEAYRSETYVLYMTLSSFDKSYYEYDTYICAMLVAVEVFDDKLGEANFIGYAEYDKDHYDKVLKQVKREKRANTVGAVVGGVLGILGLF